MKRIIANRQILIRELSTKTTTTAETPIRDLKSVLSEKVPIAREKVKAVRKNYGSTKICDVSLEMVCQGMRDLNSLVYEPSVIIPEKGIRYRGLSLAECQKLLPKAVAGKQPLPEGLFWLLLTGDMPTDAEVEVLSKDFARRSEVPADVMNLLSKIPIELHPMTHLSCAVTALSSQSVFSKAYSTGITKATYWEYIYEDCLNLIARLPVIAATIYRNILHNDSRPLCKVDLQKDWSTNYAAMMGIKNPTFTEYLRLLLCIYGDHAGGNVFAHTVRLVGSALSDPYLSYSAGINGQAGPLVGLKTQESIQWLINLKNVLGDKFNDNDIKDILVDLVNSDTNIPGFGHAILRSIDPRYICQLKFAEEHIKDDSLFKFATKVHSLVPPLLLRKDSNQNPYPNVHAISGVLLHHYGINIGKYYPVIFSVSRSLGVMASLIWDRALQLPIERPSSISITKLIKETKVPDEIQCELMPPIIE